MLTVRSSTPRWSAPEPGSRTRGLADAILDAVHEVFPHWEDFVGGADGYVLSDTALDALEVTAWEDAQAMRGLVARRAREIYFVRQRGGRTIHVTSPHDGGAVGVLHLSGDLTVWGDRRDLPGDALATYLAGTSPLARDVMTNLVAHWEASLEELVQVAGALAGR